MLFRFEDDLRTDAALGEAQRAVRVWLSGTRVDGRSAIRLSVSNWQTGAEDVGQLIRAFTPSSNLSAESSL